jgi:TfoX/Sxy family transcriptional regulator of competence genes
MSEARVEALFARIVQRYAEDPAVTPPGAGKRGKFGESALKVDGKIFAMISRGNLVVKLPRERVDGLVESGRGTHFDAGRGRVMKEWLAVPPGANRSWPKLADEARRFVGGR